MKRKLLINIFTKNRKKELFTTLLSVWKQKYKKFDILIVDDNSDEEWYYDEYFVKLFKRIADDHINLEIKIFGRVGGIAKNRAELLSKLQKYNFVLDLNDDHFLEPNVVGLLYRFLKNNEKVGAVGTATPFIFASGDSKYFYYTNGTQINTIYAVKKPKKDIVITRHVDHIFVDKYGKPIKTPIEVQHSSQFMYKPKLIDELPTNYSVLGFTEETDLSLRIRKAGKKLMFLPHAINWHFQSSHGGIREYYDKRKEEFIKHDYKIFLKNWWDWLYENQQKQS